MHTLRNFAIGLAFLVGAAAHAAPVVVTNPAQSGETIDSTTVKSIFRGKKLAWDSKAPVIVAVLKDGSTHEAFLKTAFNISASAFANHWRSVTMTGAGVAPKTFSSEEELLQFVASTPGAIGYVDEANASGAIHKVALE
ncbi:hypothetical protein ASA1KI_04910 [Opitutales bacterium ASA1]|uniref:hypothetical protein n=1 Tax=Congregicoccus parvus TaxID=3081749 RepID=UPI002B29F763|nr:hypothetical protein ASA1KI_04910 [Opitutales bacterium ASA1]